MAETKEKKEPFDVEFDRSLLCDDTECRARVIGLRRTPENSTAVFACRCIDRDDEDAYCESPEKWSNEMKEKLEYMKITYRNDGRDLDRTDVDSAKNIRIVECRGDEVPCPLRARHSHSL